ncbi:MAG: hypothetical protein UR89_C0024G0013 [Candidatus Roizmanbacteria bacterium GW2011_GWA2_35_8]|uniref:Peptidase C39-like domain-containing protein n=1 Tax=Candidatus Roizmanbacteria bacterium GW2011_GWA2_35_8 TaxID=1618479 RepID=A0A0G0CWY1_9BACT|nr:MAG: hypothetical protein UR89_C0024G0013 [Candidatus Roizmanbacteria bacterium GW2011_GWA2_35_8]
MKKTIIIASSILLVLLLVLFIFSRFKKQGGNINELPSVTPTTVPLTNLNLLTESDKNVFNRALLLTPYEDENFSFDYSPETDQLVVHEKTPQGRDKFTEWANMNSVSELINIPNLVTFTGQSTFNPTLDTKFNPAIEFLNILMNFGRGSGDLKAPDNINPQNPPSTISPQLSDFTYYAQCDSEYAELPLPSGCNNCNAGCGPTTVAMIAASYLGQNYNPQTIIGKYQTLGYELSCAGSSYIDAKSLLESLGLKTTDYLVFNYEPADIITSDLKKFIDAGWTFFTLANFTDTGGGHYFWVTDIDNQGNVWAYDPLYGRFQAPPYNENDRYPFPKYRLAFGVKK